MYIFFKLAAFWLDGTLSTSSHDLWSPQLCPLCYKGGVEVEEYIISLETVVSETDYQDGLFLIRFFLFGKVFLSVCVSRAVVTCFCTPGQDLARWKGNHHLPRPSLSAILQDIQSKLETNNRRIKCLNHPANVSFIDSYSRRTFSHTDDGASPSILKTSCSTKDLYST